MRQPHVYVLPQQFINDPSVPLRWKVYTILNGFWVNGLDAFPSNENIANKVGCTERHIRGCLLELEEIGILHRVQIGTKRYCYPGRAGGTRSSGEEPGVPGREEPGVPGREEPGVPYNSDKCNSERVNKSKRSGTAARGEPKFNPLGVEVIDAFREFNPACARYYGNTTQRAACDRLLDLHGLERLKRVVAILPQTNAKSYFPTITTPLQLEERWAALESKLKQEKDKHSAKKPLMV